MIRATNCSQVLRLASRLNTNATAASLPLSAPLSSAVSSLRCRPATAAIATSKRSFHSSRQSHAEASSGAVGDNNLMLRFVAAHEEIIKSKPVYMISVPSTTGVMGILGEHAPTVAQLQPGLITVHTNDLNDVTHTYFISGGFAIVKADSTCNVTVSEAVKVDDLDINFARKGLEEAQSELAKAKNEKETALAQIAIDVYEAVIIAIEQKM